jgi:hypothetical protein
MWTKLQHIFGRIVSSTQIEATYDHIAYHASARGGEHRFSQASSLCRYH